MAVIPRQLVDELITKYEFHPNLFDIYVEGSFDRDFINLYLNCVGLRAEVTVHAIDAIDIPSDTVDAMGLDTGSNKHRLLALSELLRSRLTKPATRVMCLVDADLDRLLDDIHVGQYVRYTDYTCMEMYVLNIAAVKRFLHFTCNLDESVATLFYAAATPILTAQFSLRSAVVMLGLNVGIPGFTSGLKDKRDLRSFDDGKYLNSFLQSHGLTTRREEIHALVDDLVSRMNHDLRHKANGHDFIALLFAFAWTQGGVRLHSKDEDVQKFGARILASGLDLTGLANEPLFSFIGALT